MKLKIFLKVINEVYNETLRDGKFIENLLFGNSKFESN